MTNDSPRGQSFTIGLTGDVMLGRLVNDVIHEKGFAYPWGDMLPLLRRPDLLLINLECTLTGATRPARDGWDKAFHFRADPAVAETLRLAGVDFVSLANNHGGDFGSEGLRETVRVLDAAGIRHAGAGVNGEEARRPAVLTVQGWRVAVVAFADYPAQWAASDGPGINYTPVSTEPGHLGRIQAVVGEASAQADFVVFSIHWGPNMRERPTPAFRDFAPSVIDAGADVFWGHSAHIVQGLELWNGRPILYDTGDFVDDYAVDPELRNDLCALFVLEVSPPHVGRIELIPVKIEDMQVNQARGGDRAWLIQHFTQLCAELATEVEIADGSVSVRVAQSAEERR
jgi:poly-gamma-glutamate synthesis protein (capsule biosynthesis protein)